MQFSTHRSIKAIGRLEELVFALLGKRTRAVQNRLVFRRDLLRIRNQKHPIDFYVLRSQDKSHNVVSVGILLRLGLLELTARRVSIVARSAWLGFTSSSWRWRRCAGVVLECLAVGVNSASQVVVFVLTR